MSTNLFTHFRRLLPAQPLLAGVVISAGSGAVVVELPGGSRVTVRGDGTVGMSVFIRGGAVEGVAPALTQVFVEV